MLKKYALSLVFVFLISTPSVSAQESTSGRVDIDSTSDAFTTGSPLSVQYDIATESIIILLDDESHDDFPSISDVAYPSSRFFYTIQKDGAHFDNYGSRYTSGYTFQGGDGTYSVDFAYRLINPDYANNKYTQWYDRIHFTIDSSQFFSSEDYTITITQKGAGGTDLSDLARTYYVGNRFTYGNPPSVRVEGDSSEDVIAETYGPGNYEYVDKGTDLF